MLHYPSAIRTYVIWITCQDLFFFLLNVILTLKWICVIHCQVCWLLFLLFSCNLCSWFLGVWSLYLNGQHSSGIQCYLVLLTWFLLSLLLLGHLFRHRHLHTNYLYFQLNRGDTWLCRPYLQLESRATPLSGGPNQEIP